LRRHCIIPFMVGPCLIIIRLGDHMVFGKTEGVRQALWLPDHLNVRKAVSGAFI
jgi:hypothetical protein